jgi:outer membrane receptor protein involved in Fe transport
VVSFAAPRDRTGPALREKIIMSLTRLGRSGAAVLSCTFVLSPAALAHAEGDPASVGASATARTSPADESTAASQVASFATTRLKDSPAVVTVISSDDIRSTGARDLIDILNLVPGYFLGVDTEGVVGPGFRGLWGHEGKILLLIDGKEMNELLFSNMQLGNEFPVELIDRVEVVRGPGSVVYGGSAELSVINVVTRGLQGASDVMVAGTYGQMTDANKFGTGYARRKLTASGRFVVDTVPGLSSFASLSIGQGQRSVRDYVDNTGASATMEGRSALDPAVVHVGVGYRDWQASFLYQHLGMTTITGSGATLAEPLPVVFDSYHGEVLATLRPSSRFEIVPRFNASYQRPWRAPNDFLYNKSVRRLRARLLGRWAALDELQITIGGDAMFDEAQLLSPAGPGAQTPFGSSDRISYQTFGGYVELFSDNPILTVSAGARYDHLSRVGGALVPRFVLLRSFGPLSFKALFSLSFRAPSIENINGGIDGGVHVTPERTRVFEFEGALDLPAEQRLSANVFDVAIDAPLAYTHDPVTSQDGYLNLGKQGTRGVEASYRVRGSAARLEANYSYYAPSAANNIAPYVVPGHSEQFLGAAAHRASIRATFQPWDGFGITPSAVILGPRFARGADAAGAETANQIPAQVLANLFVYRDNVATPGLTLGLGIYNIFGSNFQYVHSSAGVDFATDHASLPGLDREVMLRISYLFEPSEGPATTPSK